jgi:poly(beta-D-mannuronate) C5 epimerase
MVMRTSPRTALALPLVLAAAMAATPPASAADPALLADPVPAGAIVVAPNGNDSAAGTEAAPLRTLGRALTVVPAGGTVVMRAGDYREGINSVTKRVTIQPYPDERVWVKGSDVLTSWTAQGSVWLANGWTTPFCQDCYAPGAIDPAYPLAGKPEQVFVDGTPLTQVGSLAAVGAGSFYVDPADKRLYVGTNPAGRTVEVSNRWRALQFNTGAEGSILRDIGFTQFAPHFNEDQLGMVIVNASDVTLEGNTFTRSAGTALMIAKQGVRVVDNVVTDNGYRGVNMNQADGGVVSGNRIDNNNTEHFAYGSCNPCTVAGLKAAHTKTLAVTGNSFSGNLGSGFWCDLGCTDATISGNTVMSNANNGLFYEVSSRATISGNTVIRNGRGLKISGSDGVRVEGNTFLNNTTQVGIYDDGRDPASDAYSAGLGLTWNTTGTVLNDNRLDGVSGTTLLLDSNRTAQVASPQMYAQAAENAVSGNQRMVWCPAAGCTTYSTLSAFSAATGLPFGTVVTGTVEYLVNPGFEATGRWAAFGAGVPAAVSAPVRTGAGALSVTTTQTGPVVAGATDQPTGVTSTAGGRTYTAACWVRSSGPIGVFVKVQEYTPDWVRVSDPIRSSKVTLYDPSEWYPVSVTYTAGASGNLLPLTVYSADLTSSGPALLVDDCTLTQRWAS